MLVALFGIALAATIQKPLIERTEVHDQHGQYALAYTTGEMAVAQQGALKLNADRTARVIVVQVGIVEFLSLFNFYLNNSIISICMIL